MASPSLQSLPHTTAISTCTTSTTTTTTTTTTSRGSVCVASISSHHHLHLQQKQQVLQQQQKRTTKLQHHQHHQPVRPHDYHYPRNHHQTHQPHHIHPSDKQLYTPQQGRQLQSKVLEQEEQQCSASNIASATTSNLAELNQHYPTRIALPDGEERPFISSVSRRSKDKVSELTRECIKPPANKTLFDLQYCPAHQFSSIPSQLSEASPPDQSIVCSYTLTPASSPQMLSTPQHYIHHYHPSVTSPPGRPMLSTSPICASSVRHRSCHHRDARSTETRSVGDTRNPNASPQPIRKSKNILAIYVANLTSSPKNRKESNPRKSSPQNSNTSICYSSSCSSGSSCGLANNCCGGYRYKSFPSKIEGREKGSLIVPSVPENPHSYSTSSPILQSAVDNKDVSILINASVPSNENFTQTLPCPSGPSSVADVTLLTCYPSSSGQTQEASVQSSTSHREEPIRFQVQHYQLPQYVQAEYQHDSTVSAMLSSQHYGQQCNDRLHEPLTSSFSSSPPLSPTSPSLPSESSHKFQSFVEMSSRMQCPLDVSSRDANRTELSTSISTPVELREVYSPDIDGRIHSPDVKSRINSPEYMSERIRSPVCFEDGSESPLAVLDSISIQTSYRSISSSDKLSENTTPCVQLHTNRQRTEISEMQTGTINRRTPPRNGRSNRPTSLAADQLKGVSSQSFSSYKEVLHSDHYRIPKSDSKSNSTASLSSLDRESLLPASSEAPIFSQRSGSTSPVDSGGQVLENENKASSESVDVHHENNFSVSESEWVQAANTNSSVTGLYEACCEKEVI
ncbi:hypothetical protein FHG87_003157 [Trinorchestia longiramus]|nr:hypothetical protein FHG87_003157 [Trinorchestia longiramus]